MSRGAEGNFSKRSGRNANVDAQDPKKVQGEADAADNKPNPPSEMGRLIWLFC